MQELLDLYQHRFDKVYIPEKTTYHQEIIECRHMCLNSAVIFSECTFPNLRLLTVSDDIKMPFFNCTFEHDLNLEVNAEVNWNLPAEINIRSVRNTTYAEISWHQESYYLKSPSQLFRDYHITKKVCPGTSPQHVLKTYAETFALSQVYFAEEVPQMLLKSSTFTVVYNNITLGTVNFELVMDEFTEAILNASEQTLTYSSSVPADWSNQTTKYVRDCLNKLSKISIEGDLGARAFANMELNLKELEVTGALPESIFWMSEGTIHNLKANSIEANTLDGCEVYLHRVELVHLNTQAELEADLVSLAYSKDVAGISYAKTLIIRESFENALDLGHLDLTLVDFSQVQTPAPYVVKNFGQISEQEYAQPEIIHEIIYGEIYGCNLKHIQEEIIEDMQDNFSADEFTLHTDAFNDITVKMIYNHEVLTVGKWIVYKYGWKDLTVPLLGLTAFGLGYALSLI